MTDLWIVLGFVAAIIYAGWTGVGAIVFLLVMIFGILWLFRKRRGGDE